MTRKKLEDRNTRKLAKVGGGKTYSITLPVDIIRELEWKQGQKLEVKKYGKAIVLRDWKEEE